MAERPILFSAPMVRALLAGTKTQTRRVVKPQFASKADIGHHGLGQPFIRRHEGKNTDCPYGQPGDRLWVKEKTVKVEPNGWVGPVFAESNAGRRALEWGYGESDDPDHIPPHAIKFRPSLFMTRAMSRLTLEITGVRVERLQDISVADAMAEGVVECAPHLRGLEPCMEWSYAYEDLWTDINGAGSWDSNPWVWVVEFKVQSTGTSS